jgi:flagellar basal-body rod protein FlgF
MSGSQYIALSGLRARIDELDRLSGDIANVGTAGYKGQRDTTTAAARETFDQSLQSAIDTTKGAEWLDMADGAMHPTGRPLDVAIGGKGFFVIDTPAGERYTRNGHFTLDAERRVVTEDGHPVRGTDGPITLTDGEARIDTDGSIWIDKTKAGQFAVVTFADPSQLGRDGASRLHANGQTATEVEAPVVHAGALEQSNVSVSDRIAELTTVSRNFEALQKALSLMMNDIDGRAIDQLGRRA